MYFFKYGQKVRVGVFGGAFEWTKEVEQLAKRIGRAIARHDCIVVTGATTGLPDVAAKAARKAGSKVLGISPARNPKEHVEVFKKPFDGCDHIIWTGMGYTGRNFLNLRNVDAAIFVGGETGTMEEFCIAVYEGKVIGVLEDSGPACNHMIPLYNECKNKHESVLVSDADPGKLVRKVIAELQKRGADYPSTDY